MRSFCALTVKALAGQRLICRSPAATLRHVFDDLLREATPTAFGREHGLAHVRNLEAWKRAVPIRSYAALRGYIDRQLSGERHVLTRDDPYAFLKTSGTTGQEKLVPTTRHWRLAYRGPALYAQWGLYFKLLRLDAPNVDNIVDLSWQPQTASRRIDGFPVYSITQRPASLGETDWSPPWFEAPWFAAGIEPEDYSETLYQRLQMQATCDVRLIVSVNPSKIIAFAEALRDFAPRLIRDLSDGLPGAVFGSDRGLARRLEGRLAARDGNLLLTDLWPNLALVVCWNSASAQLYESWLDRLIPGVARLPFSTTGTEGIVTLPVDTHRSAGPLAVNQGLYEFVPVDDLLEDVVPAEDADTLSLHELEVGRCYRLVMSQANGLWRYDIGDVYRVIGRVGAVPRLEFAGRSGAFSSFTGEKLTETDVFSAVSRSLQEASADAPNFSCFPVWGTPPHYVVAIEWSDGLQRSESQALAKRIDQALSAVNVEYAAKQSGGRLGPLAVVKLAPGAFAKAARQRIGQGSASAQIKHHWLQRDASMLKVLDDLGVLLA
jgi:hypothetical protein